MSLSERVTSVETIPPQRGTSPPALDPPQLRKLSFNPLPTSWRPPEPTEVLKPLGAFEVAKTKRKLQVIVAVLYCLCSGGIVFGYAALKPVLIREKVYRDLCTEDELRRGVRICFDQELHLNLMFVIAAVGTNVAALPVGATFDKFGPNICAICGSLFLATGSLLLSFAWQLPFDGYSLGYLFLALGGSFVFISSFHLSNSFPKHSGMILAFLTGAFDSSSAVFLVYRMLYQWSDGSFKPRKFFLLFITVPALIFILQLFLMPKQAYKNVGELVRQVEEIEEDQQVAEVEASENSDVNEQTSLLLDENRANRQSIVSEITDLLGSKSGTNQRDQEEYKTKVSGVWGAMHEKSVLKQVLSPWFFLMALLSMVQMIRINYFMATIRPQYTYILRSYQKAVEINTFFDVALPLGGILSIPFIGLVLDNTSTFSVLGALVTISTTIGVLGVLPYTWAAYANVCLFVLYRPFYYTAVSDYTAKVFGFTNFGKVYGLIICSSGVFNFAQSGLDTLLHKNFHGDPVPVNVMLLAITVVIGVVLCVFVGVQAYRMRRVSLEEEAEHAREIVMPGAQDAERL